MPQPPSFAELRQAGGGARLRGFHQGFALTGRPIWHETAAAAGKGGRLVCAGLAEVLAVDVYLTADVGDPGAARKTFRALVRDEAELQLTDLTFRGYVTSAKWTQVTDEEGRFTGAVLSLELHGEEAP